ncbi:MAG: uracil-DNA glycosylase family protein [Zymomonas mobilis subsp. pomaceae]|uniref:Uracil-DNA glycosylase superfamily n=1 Tax=Zymomonas mobilis subsp. pomaceae (strain ATCC 29192 / DSM 22645 / JCM 10191 / CCUG 17912 / NBRC 13757 / NCIMB 11200 / NRRL B-4491 / Barker I) TaxID=579138 RepID=F8ETL0_ZYMMT|nr:uracil-DNA glycosylase family protein [Zymomonas mobilis]AEI37020.1 Uracil-DNA glycosylase superfamily [Zymomonas mobilis subsp. pomaceae ATCC 29192]MDX5948392.1 uracil-DNA glycosylase family protein [Zymomonas mobilis subsp. pomaceae]GEB89618.1 DNA polymerase [Zymomonas mobilis subsp. pomaceae]
MTLDHILEWWRMAGVDILVQEENRNWFSENQYNISYFNAPSSHPQAESNTAGLNPEVPSVPFNEQKNTVHSTSTPEPSALIKFKNIPDNITDFLLWFKNIGTNIGHNTPVLPVVNPKAHFMIMSDAPEIKDVEEGTLFSGQTGQLLSNILRSISVKKEQSYWATLTPFCSELTIFDQRPKESDALTFSDYISIARHHLALIRPKYLLLLGETPTRAFLKMNVTEARRKVHHITVNGDNIRVFALLHPKMLLATPALKATIWKDLRILKRDLDNETSRIEEA